MKQGFNYQRIQSLKSLNNCILSADKWFSKDGPLISKLILAIVLTSIILWQLSFYNLANTDINPQIATSEHIDKKTIFSYRDLKSRIKMCFLYMDKNPYITASQGISYETLFSYGLYYWGLFPVYPVREFLPAEFSSDELFYSKKGADLIMEKYGNVLSMDYLHLIAFGDVGKYYLPYFHALLKKSPKDASFKSINAVFFIASLLVLFIVSWWYNKGLLGLLLVVFLGSYQFQIYEVYQNNNVFGYTIITAILMTALFWPIILNIALKTWKQIAICIVSGILFAALYSIRSEPLVMSLGVIFALIFYNKIRCARKVWLILVFIASFFCAEISLNSYVDYKVRQASLIVAEKGGDVFTLPRKKHHLFWHPIWCGLGDFDDKYGYEWHDDAPRAFAERRFVEKYGRKIGEGITPAANYDRSFYLPPEYEILIREKIIKDIINDPLWYFKILFKRLMAIAIYAAAYKVNFMGFNVRFFHLSIPCFLILSILLFLKRWDYIKLLIFSFPTAAVALFVYCGGGMTLYFVGHLYCLAMSIYLLLKIPLIGLSSSAVAKADG